MRRREFITLLGGTTATWPLAVRAQQPRRMRRIGVLTPFPADDAEGHARLTAFTQALQQLGWTVGQNVRIDYRWGPGNPATMRKHATELVALAPDLILALTTAAVGPLLEASRTVPIVFVTVADPVGAGFVETLARPGGNATGFTPYKYSISGNLKRLEAGALVVGPDLFFLSRRDRLVALVPACDLSMARGGSGGRADELRFKPS
jgi:putative tryptophan/tyrosine transport system substrate-binding protein